MPRTLWINAGELSGDMQAASVARALKAAEPSLRLVGMGGPDLAAAGQDNLFRVESLSVMGLAEVFSALPRALKMLHGIGKALDRLRPQAVLLVDAPEFNFRVATMARKRGIPVYYFIPPKVWAWRTGRVAFLRENVRELLCILPFEEAFYRRHGLAVHYVGNPLVDMVNWPALKDLPPVSGRVGLMPGSRRKEVRELMPLFGETAKRLLLHNPHLHFHCLRAPNMREEDLRGLWPEQIPLHMDEPETRYQAMRGCECILAASGTATLETALAGVPTVVAYKVSPLSAYVGRKLVRISFMSLPNLILNRELFPEFLQETATPDNLAAAAQRWLHDSPECAAVHAGLDELRTLCGTGGSAERAAAVLLKSLGASHA